MQGRSITAFVARNVAHQRKLAGMTQAQVAEKISVEKESVSRMESGRISLSLDRLQQLSELFGCAVIDFFKEQSSSAEEHAASIIDMIRPLSEEERVAIVHFIGDVVRLFLSRNKNI